MRVTFGQVLVFAQDQRHCLGVRDPWSDAVRWHVVPRVVCRVHNELLPRVKRGHAAKSAIAKKLTTMFRDAELQLPEFEVTGPTMGKDTSPERLQTGGFTG